MYTVLKAYFKSHILISALKFQYTVVIFAVEVHVLVLNS